VQSQQVLALMVLAPLVPAALASLEQARQTSLVQVRQTSLVQGRLASLAQGHPAFLVPGRLAQRRDHQSDHPQDRPDLSSWARRLDPDLALRLECQLDPDLVQNWDPARGRPEWPLHVV